MNTTFSILLSQLIEQMGFTTRQACSFLKKKDVHIPYSTLAGYKAFDTVPSIDRARQILNAFSYDIDDSALNELIEYSKEENRKLKESNGYVQTGIRLSVKQFGKNIDNEQLSLILTQRANELSELIEGQPSLNSYVSYLIKKDLMESGYIANKGEKEI